MTKGKPWPAEDEAKLRDWFNSGIIELGVLAFSFDWKYTEEAIRQKLIKLGLQEEQQVRISECCCSSELDLPKELPSVEETLKVLAAALRELNTPGLEKAEILRLRGIITGAKIYQERFALYIGYRKIEAELLEVRRKYAELRKKMQSDE